MINHKTDLKKFNLNLKNIHKILKSIIITSISLLFLLLPLVTLTYFQFSHISHSHCSIEPEKVVELKPLNSPTQHHIAIYCVTQSHIVRCSTSIMIIADTMIQFRICDYFTVIIGDVKIHKSIKNHLSVTVCIYELP